MKKIIFGIIIGLVVTIGIKAIASNGSVPSFVDKVVMQTGYPDIAKMYDPYANVVCYEVRSNGYNGATISCVSLK